MESQSSYELASSGINEAELALSGLLGPANDQSRVHGLCFSDIESEHSEEEVLAGTAASNDDQTLMMIANLFEQKEFYKDALTALRAEHERTV
jgi:hypothetical protein